jgi:hypothetical protein
MRPRTGADEVIPRRETTRGHTHAVGAPGVWSVAAGCGTFVAMTFVSVCARSRMLVLAVLACACLVGLAADGSTPATAAPATCPPATRDSVRVIRLQRGLGCKTGLRLAVAAVNDGGYYKDSRRYCRWGQGGTRPIRVNGHVYYSGFCYRVSDMREAGFLARRIR